MKIILISLITVIMLHRNISPISSMLVTTLFLFSGSSFLFILIAIHGTLSGYSQTQIAIITSSYYIGQLFGTFTVQHIIERVGYIRAFSIFVMVFAMTALLLINCTFPLWILLRLIAGISMASLVIVIETWINEKANNANRGQLFCTYMFIYYIAFGGGQFLINIPFLNRMSFFLLANLLICFSMIPFCLTRIPEPTIHLKQKGQKPMIGPLFKKAPLGFVGMCVSGASNASFYGLSSLFGKSIGLSITEISILNGITILSGLLLQWPIGYLSDRLGRRVIMLLLSMLIMMGSLLMIIASIQHWSLLSIVPCSILYGASSFALYPVCNAYTNDLIEPHERLYTSRILIMFFSCSSATGPLFIGYFMSYNPSAGLYGTILAFHIMLVFLNIVRQVTTPLPKKKRKSRIILFPHTFSPVIGTMVNRWRNRKKTMNKQ